MAAAPLAARIAGNELAHPLRVGERASSAVPVSALRPRVWSCAHVVGEFDDWARGVRRHSMLPALSPESVSPNGPRPPRYQTGEISRYSSTGRMTERH
jgi:hypothetical protein